MCPTLRLYLNYIVVSKKDIIFVVGRITSAFVNVSEFFSLDVEFEAGRSKLAKLRERIRRAKGVIKDADAALQNSS